MSEPRKVTMRELDAQGWSVRLVRWDGYHERVKDIALGEFLAGLGIRFAEPTQHKGEGPGRDQ